MPIVADPRKSADLVPWSRVRRWPVLPEEFYLRPTIEVARGVLGKVLVHGRRAGRIVEVEAYLGEQDPAAHAWRGRTRRTEVLYGLPGRAYVYLIYGMHECLNLVAEPAGVPGCILVRAIEPLCGLGEMHAARPHTTTPALGSGPGNLTRAMGITREHYGTDLTRGALTLRESPDLAPGEILVSPRIGIRHAREAPLRFYLAENKSVSGPRRRPRRGLQE